MALAAFNEISLKSFIQKKKDAQAGINLCFNHIYNSNRCCSSKYTFCCSYKSNKEYYIFFVCYRFLNKHRIDTNVLQFRNKPVLKEIT